MNSVFVCFKCKGRLNIASFDKRLKAGRIKRVKVNDEFKSFHDYCFENYIKDNPEWYT